MYSRFGALSLLPSIIYVSLVGEGDTCGEVQTSPPFGGPATSRRRPAALRLRLAAGLPLSWAPVLYHATCIGRNMYLKTQTIRNVASRANMELSPSLFAGCSTTVRPTLSAG